MKFYSLKIASPSIFFIFLSLFFSASASIDEWEITEYLWNFGIIASCDIGPDKSPIRQFEQPSMFDREGYRAIQAGDLVWLQCCHIKLFVERALPIIENPFILIILDGDESFPSDSKLGRKIEILLRSKKIIHIFTQNYDYQGQSKKISPIPIGLDYRTIAYKHEDGYWNELGSPIEQEAVLKEVVRSLKPTRERKLGAFVDFQHTPSMIGSFQRCLQFGEDRAGIFNTLLTTGLIDYGEKMRRSDLWRKKGEYIFSISPPGNGLDCHRTWEDLILGCIVIVKSSPLNPLYEGLPVIVIDDWKEMTKENMEKWLKQYEEMLQDGTYREKLTHNYWIGKILSKK